MDSHTVGLQRETLPSFIFLATTILKPGYGASHFDSDPTTPCCRSILRPIEANGSEVDTAESSACLGVTADAESPDVSSFLQIAISDPSNSPRSAEGME